MSNFNLVGTIETTRPVSFGVAVIFYGDENYAFLETEKEAMMALIAEAVTKELLPGTEAELFTMSLS